MTLAIRKLLVARSPWLRGTRVGSRPSWVRAAATAALTLYACSGQPGLQTERDEQSLILDALGELGAVEDDVEFADNGDVVVEGDMVFTRESLLQSISPFGSREKASSHRVFTERQISRISRIVTVAELPPATEAHLSFAANVPTEWRDALTRAAGIWSRNECIDLVAGNRSVRQVDVEMVSIPCTGSRCVAATATLPTRGRRSFELGKRISINRNVQLDSAAQVEHVALHELGHILGFAHPNEAAHIPGTASGTGYETVMVAVGPGPNALTADDVLARDTLYRPVTVSSRGIARQTCPSEVTLSSERL